MHTMPLRGKQHERLGAGAGGGLFFTHGTALQTFVAAALAAGGHECAGGGLRLL